MIYLDISENHGNLSFIYIKRYRFLVKVTHGKSEANLNLLIPGGNKRSYVLKETCS